jgi:cytochrome c556
MHGHQAAAGAVDERPLVKFPETMRIHMLANMRDHLLALQEIQEALARQQYDKAADTAEQRLGMSSLKLHGAHEVAGFMPEAMQAIGTGMHQAASRLAIAAKDAAATGEVKPVLEAMARVTAQCVACHAGYRVQ